jgi:predicted lipoprotein with Yx(FWY)xxD motif
MKTTRTTWAHRTPIAGLVLAAASFGAAAVLPTTAAGAATNTAKVSAQTIGTMGKVLVANGKALYVLSPSKTGCNSACLAIWPALRVPSGAKGATAGSGVEKSKLGVTKDSAGARQVTYNKKAVYSFVGDSKGTVKGDITDQWGKWTAVVVTRPKSTSGAGSNSNTSSSTAGGGGVNF